MIMLNWGVFCLMPGYIRCTLVQNETVSFRNYFDVFIAIKVLYFEPTYISGIKAVSKISEVFPLFIPLLRNLEAVFW